MSRISKIEDDSVAIGVAAKGNVKVSMIVKPKKKPPKLTSSTVNSFMTKVSGRMNKAQAIKRALPELELVDEIYRSSIMNPRDYTSSAPSIRTTNVPLDDRGVSAALALLNEHFNSHLQLEERMTTSISEALFDYGSYNLAVLPVSLMSDIISATQGKVFGTESFKSTMTGYNKSIGLVTPDHDKKLGVEILDNVRLLAGPRLADISRANTSNMAYGIESIESVSISMPEEIEGEIHPMVLKIPHDAILPVHSPSDPADHLSYYVLIDENGYPISRINDGTMDEAINKLNRNSSTTDQNNDAIIQASKLLGMSGGSKELSKDDLMGMYIDNIDEMVLKARSGTGDDGSIVVGRPVEVYSVMMARALANKSTKMIYIDKRLVSYMAYDYTSDGIGFSLMDKVSKYSGMRILSLAARFKAYIANSIANQELNITLDENTIDPGKDVSDIITEFVSMTSQAMNIDVTSVDDGLTSLQRAGITVNVDGGEAFPKTKTTLVDKARDMAVPDDAMDDYLRELQYQGLRMPIEIVDSAKESEFATGIAMQHKLLAKRIMGLQKITTANWTEFTRMYTRLNNVLITAMQEALDAEKSKVILSDIVNNLYVHLPEPDTSRTETNTEAIEAMRGVINLAVRSKMNPDALGDLLQGDTMPDSIEPLLEAVTDIMLGDWIQDNNIMPSMDDMFDPNSETNFVERLKANLDKVGPMIVDILSSGLKADRKADKKISKLEEKLDQQDEEPEETPDEEPTDDATVDDNSESTEGDDELTDF